MNIKRIASHPYFSLALALVCLAALTASAVLEYARLRPGAPLIFTLDDTYIHMALAKNLALYGVMGINPDGFTSSSSSILWTLLLAAWYRVLGVSALAPLWLNLIFACLAVWRAWRWLRRALSGRPWLLAGGMVGFVFFVPLAPLILTGMEASLHIFLALWFLESALDALTGPQEAGPQEVVGRGNWARLALAAALFGATRYESLAMIGLVCALLFLARRFRLTALTLGCAVLPAVIFGVFSLAQGWNFLPNSLILRSATGVLANPLAALPERVGNLWNEPHLFALMVGALAGLLWDLQRPLPDARGRWLGTIFVLTLMTHVVVDHFGYFYRYEAYVMALGVLALAVLWGPRIGRLERASTVGQLRGLLAGLVIFLALMPLYARGMEAQRATPYGMANIYDQHYQVARFLKEYYAGSAIGVHDIGLVGFLSDVHVVDLVGLANRATARSFNQGAAWTEAMDAELQRSQVKVVVAYPGWVGPYLPAGWQPVASWTVDRRITVGNTKMSFYAQDEAEAQALRAHLAEYAPALDASIKVEEH